MSMYLVAAFVLLVGMLFLVLRPFLLAGVEPVPAVADVAPRPVVTTQRVATAPPATDTPAADASAGTASAPAAGTDVRAAVEAAIAARKAALRVRHCTTCEGTIEDGDVFCRSCGTKVSA
jgi:hypothetical protein